MVFELKEDGIYIQNESLKFRVSYDETKAPWGEARDWCKERGGDLGTVEQLRLISKYKNELNAALKGAGKGSLDGWYWTDEDHYRDSNCAYLVAMHFGDVYHDYKNATTSVRAVSAF